MEAHVKDTAPLEERIGYTFQNRKYLDIALTHSSYANEMKKNLSSNERQEFLGDAVLSIIVSDYLFHTFHLAEGDLTKLRAAMVCEKSLCEFARQFSLGDYLKLGRGEEMMGGRTRHRFWPTRLRRCSRRSTSTGGSNRRADSCSASSWTRSSTGTSSPSPTTRRCSRRSSRRTPRSGFPTCSSRNPAPTTTSPLWSRCTSTAT